LIASGRVVEAAQQLRARLAGAVNRPVRIVQLMNLLLAFAEEKYDNVVETGQALFGDFIDPEGHFYWARHLSRMGEQDLALAELRRSIAGGYFCAQTLTIDPWLEPLRAQPEFAEIRSEAAHKRRAALEAFCDAGGPELLGVSEPA
jgi:hypothetical protein